VALLAAQAAHEARVQRILQRQKDEARRSMRQGPTMKDMLAALPAVSDSEDDADTDAGMGTGRGSGAQAPARQLLPGKPAALKPKAGKHVKQRPDVAAIAQFAAIATNAAFRAAPIATMRAHLEGALRTGAASAAAGSAPPHSGATNAKAKRK
jgi:hypothetical protein